MKIDEQLLDIQMINNSKKSLLDLFIRRTAVLTSTPESLVEKIIKDQWHRANKVTQPESSIGEIDFCNLGTMYMSKTKGKKKILRFEKYNLELEDEERIKDNIQKINSIKRKIKLTTDESEC